MEILITGGLGFIGSNLVKKLQDEHEVTVIDNFFSSSKNLNGIEKLSLLVDDVSRSYIDINKDFDLIFHLASITDTTFENRMELLKQNCFGFSNMLSLARRKKSKLIYASSAGVYGNKQKKMEENKILQPLNAYSASKLWMDQLANYFSKEISIVGLRYFNVYGLGEDHKEKSSSMILQLYQQMKKNDSPKLFKYGKQKRDFIYIDDVIEATIKAIEAPPGIYNIGTGKATSFNKIVKILNKLLNKNLKPTYINNPYKKVYQNYTKANTEKAKKLLNFKAKYSIKQGIKKYIGELESLTR